MPLMGDVQELRDHMTAIASAPSPGAAAVDAARQRFDRKGRDLIGRVRDIGRRQIQPVKQIMAAAARNSWGAILQGSRVSINRVWRDEVLPAFAKLEARFPLAAKSSREARLVDFARFFRPCSTLVRTAAPSPWMVRISVTAMARCDRPPWSGPARNSPDRCVWYSPTGPAAKRERQSTVIGPGSGC